MSSELIGSFIYLYLMVVFIAVGYLLCGLLNRLNKQNIRYVRGKKVK